MICLIFASHKEAKPFIDAMDMVIMTECHHYKHYVTTRFDIPYFELVIVGVGNINAAINTTAFLMNSKKSPDLFVNIGASALVSKNSTDQIYLCNKLKELSTGRTYYPDMLTPHPFTEAYCLTSPTPVARDFNTTGIIYEDEADTPLICDMEASSIYQAITGKYKTHQISFVKYVSDTGISAENSSPDIAPSKEITEQILDYLYKENEVRKLFPKANNLTLARAATVTNIMAKNLTLSTTMHHELEKYMRYYECCGYNSSQFTNEFVNSFTEEVPVSKIRSKEILAEVKKYITGIKPLENKYPSDEDRQVAPFSHIYVERQAKDYPLTGKILERFADKTVVYIDHYKDIFNRHGQDFLVQKNYPALILSINNSTRIYPGARTCQAFGHEHFYYTSQIKNCIYDCEYCYLQGMYPSGNINIFVNTEDYFNDIRELLKKHPVSLSISYDTDMTALNGITGLIEEWYELAKEEPELTIEIRTKCGATNIFNKLAPIPNLVFAFTLSPSYIADKYEHNASDYESRKKALYKCLESGFTTRLSLDPVLPIADFENIYTEMVDDLFSNPSTSLLKDISIGSFRISKDYIKTMQDVRINHITTYPYSINDGICGFDKDTAEHITKIMKDSILKYVSEDKLFIADN